MTILRYLKKNKKGLKGKFKLIGQISLGLIIGLILFYHPDVTIKDRQQIDGVEKKIEYKETFNLQKFTWKLKYDIFSWPSAFKFDVDEITSIINSKEMLDGENNESGISEGVESTEIRGKEVK